MRGKGINYDTGFCPGGVNSREHFDPDIVRGEMRVIARELRCTAVRISGGEPARLSIAGELAAGEGLEVWLAPFPCELTTDELAPLFAECADRAEHLRRSGANVVLVTGMGWAIIDASTDPPRLDGDYVRDEAEQVRYLEELNAIFAEEGVDLAFWFTFAGYSLIHDTDARRDLDMASYGVVAMLPGGPGTGGNGLGWKPKLAFSALADA